MNHRIIINVEVAEMLRHEPDCIRARVVGDDSLRIKGCRVEIDGPSSVIFDDGRTEGARVWVETLAPVKVTSSNGEVKEINR